MGNNNLSSPTICSGRIRLCRGQWKERTCHQQQNSLKQVRKTGPYPITDQQGHIANRISKKQTPIRHDAHDANHVRVSSIPNHLTRRPINIARNYSVCGNLHVSYVHPPTPTLNKILLERMRWFCQGCSKSLKNSKK